MNAATSTAPAAPGASLGARSRSQFRSLLLAALAPLGLFVLTLVPIIALAFRALEGGGDAVAHVLDTQLVSALMTTLTLGLTVGGGSVVVGVTAAWVVARLDFPGRRLFEVLFMLPLAIPGYVFAFVYVGAFDYSGWLQSFARDSLGMNGGFNVRNLVGASFVLTLAFYPYVYALARGAFLAQSRNLIDASRILGASVTGHFFRVALPAAAPAILGGLSLVLMETFADFGSVSVLGVSTLTTSIYKSWFALYSLSAAARLALLLLALLTLVLLVLDRVQKRGIRFSDFGGAGRVSAPPRLTLGLRARMATFGFAVGLSLLGFVLPLVQLLSWAEASWSSQDWGQLGRSLINTLVLATGAASLVIVASVALALSLRIVPHPILRAFRRASLLGYAVPGTVLAVGLFAALAAFDRIGDSWGLGLSFSLAGSLVGVLFGLLVRFLAVGYKPVQAGLDGLAPSLDDAAQSLGSSFADRVRRVHLPLLAPSLAAGFLLAFIDIIKEMPLTLMTRPLGWDTLAVRVFQYTTESDWQRAAVPALILLLLGLIVSFYLLERLNHVRK